MRHHKQNSQCEKYIMRKATELYGDNLLPKEVLWRTKEAFSDGVSKETKSWYEIIQEHIEKTEYGHISERVKTNVLSNMNPYRHNKPKTLEQLYYREIFSKHYTSESSQKIIPYFWMPKFVEASDASARVLDVYQTTQNANNL